MAPRPQSQKVDVGAQALFDSAVAHIDVLQWAEAERLLKAALRRQKTFPDAYIQLGTIALARGKLTVAERAFTRALEQARAALPKRIPVERWWHIARTRPYLRALRGVGLVAYRRGKRRKALATFQELLRLNPDDHLGVGYFVQAILAGKTWRQMDVPGRQ